MQVEKKFHSRSYLLLKAAAFRLCELARSILANEKQQIDKAYNTTTATAANFKEIP